MQRGDVWLINLDPTIGAEIRKTRPAVVVNDDGVGVLPLRVIVPLTDWKERYRVASWMVRIEPHKNNGLEKLSAADTFQIRSVAQERFIRQIGRLTNIQIQEITKALAAVLAIKL